MMPSSAAAAGASDALAAVRGALAGLADPSRERMVENKTQQNRLKKEHAELKKNERYEEKKRARIEAKMSGVSHQMLVEELTRRVNRASGPAAKTAPRTKRVKRARDGTSATASTGRLAPMCGALGGTPSATALEEALDHGVLEEEPLHDVFDEAPEENAGASSVGVYVADEVAVDEVRGREQAAYDAFVAGAAEAVEADDEERAPMWR